MKPLKVMPNSMSASRCRRSKFDQSIKFLVCRRVIVNRNRAALTI
jgi:hypothetical protein